MVIYSKFCRTIMFELLNLFCTNLRNLPEVRSYLYFCLSNNQCQTHENPGTRKSPGFNETTNFLTAIVSPPFWLKSFIHLDLPVFLKTTFTLTLPLV